MGMNRFTLMIFTGQAAETAISPCVIMYGIASGCMNSYGILSTPKPSQGHIIRRNVLNGSSNTRFGVRMNSNARNEVVSNTIYIPYVLLWVNDICSFPVEKQQVASKLVEEHSPCSSSRV